MLSSMQHRMKRGLLPCGTQHGRLQAWGALCDATCLSQHTAVQVRVLDRSMAHITTACRKGSCSLSVQRGRGIRLLEVPGACRQMSCSCFTSTASAMLAAKRKHHCSWLQQVAAFC